MRLLLHSQTMDHPVLQSDGISNKLEIPADCRELLHQLNQAYRHEFDRAERLQAELTSIHNSRAWRWMCWLRWLKRRICSYSKISIPDFPNPFCPLTVNSFTPTASVSIIIPVKDRGALLCNLLASMQVSSYRNFELVIVDNGSLCPYTKDYLSYLSTQDNTKVLRSFGSFNFSLLCNLGAMHSSGDMLLFLNNDMEVLHADWLEQLLLVAGQPAVGVTGSTLLYPDGTLQHAGIFPDKHGQWHHVYRGFAAEYPGDCEELRSVRAIPAITGACLMVRRDLFQQLGGFAEQYPVTGNDIDLCCRVRRLGLLVAITPHARLCHYESLSRGYSVDSVSRSISDPI